MSKKLAIAIAIVPLLALAACNGSGNGSDPQTPAFGPSPPVTEEVQVGLPEWDFSAAPVDGVSLEIEPETVDFCAGPQAVTLRWNLGVAMAAPQVWVQGGNARPKLFAAPDGIEGEAASGPWVDESTVFFLIDGGNGRVLREARPTPATCN